MPPSIYYLLNNEEVTDKNENIDFAGLSSALYLMKLNKLQYSDKPCDKRFAQYIDIVTNLRNDENHTGKALTAKDIVPGIHVVSALYLYVAFVRISDLEMREAELESQKAVTPVKHAPVHDYSLVDDAEEEEYQEVVLPQAAESNGLSSLTEEQKIIFFQHVLTELTITADTPRRMLSSPNADIR